MDKRAPLTQDKFCCFVTSALCHRLSPLFSTLHHPMRPALFLFATLFALVGFAADAPADAPAAQKPARQIKGQSNLPESVDGVPAEEYAKIRRALMMSYGNETISAARIRLNELKERTRFTKGRNEAEDLRLDFEKARDAMVKATMDSVLKLDPSINKDSLVFTLNAIEEATKKRGQEATQRAREKEAAEAKLAKKDAPEAKPETTEAKVEEKPMTPAQLLADVEGVSAEDMKKFRVAAVIAQKDPTVKELKAKQNEMRKEAEFASPDEKKNMRNDFETLMADLRKANLAAVSKAAPSLSKETLEKIMEAVENRAKDAAKKKGAKATKTPLKPFPFGEKK